MATIFSKEENKQIIKNTKQKLHRLDSNDELKKILFPLCRLKYGEIWEDPISGHKVGVLDATNSEHIKKIMAKNKAKLIINDPPYNIAVGNSNTSNLFKKSIDEYIKFSKAWINNAIDIMDNDSYLYIWLGLDYKDDFQPLPDFIIMMRSYKELKPKNIITMRNQRGYGTKKIGCG